MNPPTTDTAGAVAQALQDAAANRPAVQGFPYYAETLRRAGVRRTEWALPAMQCVYLTDAGAVVHLHPPVVDGAAEVPVFDTDALVAALRADQAGESTFPAFASAAFAAGVVRWIVDLEARRCTYFGCGGETFDEPYAAVSLPADGAAARNRPIA